MTLNLLRAGALSCALLTSTALCTQPAFAQEASGNVSPPAENFVVAPGGVDMRSGRYAYSQTDLTIGGDAGGLALTRTLVQPVLGHNSPFANFSHNWEIMISEKRIDIDQGLFRHATTSPNFQIEVTFAGKTETFRSYNGTTGFDQVSRSGFARLDTDTGSFRFRTGDGTEAIFRSLASADCSSALRCAYVSQVTQADGTRLSFNYDNAGGNATRLRSVVSNRGYALLFEYSGQLIAKSCVLNLAVAPKPSDDVCPAGAPTSTYSYDTNAGDVRLASATDPSGGVWGFVNASGSQGFVRPGETTPWLTNAIGVHIDGDGLAHPVVTGQSFADGSSYSYAFDYTPDTYGPYGLEAPSIAGGTYTDQDNRTVAVRYGFPFKPFPGGSYGDVCGESSCPPSPTIVYQVTPGPVEVTDQLGRTTTSDYCDPTALANLPPTYHHRCIVMPAALKVTSPEGRVTRMIWDFGSRVPLQTRQVAPAGSGDTDIVRSSTYDCTLDTFRHCSSPVTETDARGAVTNNDYDPAHGGLTRQRLPAATSGAPRPETRHEYAQRYAWVSNGAGGYVQAATPVWVRTASSTCRTSAATGNPSAPCATSGDEVRTSYDYGPDSGPNNLALRGQAVTADGQTLRTCFTYDAQGRRIAETSPGAQLAQCQ